jgi:8-oxo-dGTP diphosphatase
MVDAELIAKLTRIAADEGVQQLVVGAMITRNNQVLLLKRRSDDFMAGIYELPSGKVEAGEGLPDALGREVTEETGLIVDAIIAYLGSFDYTSGSGKTSRQFNFAVTVAATQPITLTEHDTYLWADLNGRPPVTEAVADVLRSWGATQLQ